MLVPGNQSTGSAVPRGHQSVAVCQQSKVRRHGPNMRSDAGLGYRPFWPDGIFAPHMRTADRIALLLGQIIALLRESPEKTGDLKAALRDLVDIADQRSLSVRVGESGLFVEGIAVEGDQETLSQLQRQMETHLVAELRLAHGAAAIDVLHLVRGIAHNLSDYGPGHVVDEHLKKVGATTVSVVSTSADAARQQRSEMRITDAVAASHIDLDQPGTPAAPKSSEPPPPAPVPSASAPSSKDGTDLELVSAHTGRAYDDTIRSQISASASMSEAIRQLDANAPGTELLKQLDTVQGSVVRALDRRRIDQAIDAVAALTQKEAEATGEESRRAFGVALRRLLTESNLQRFAAYLLDDLYASDVILLIKRAGKPGTKVILELLAKAPTFAERKAYLRMLRQVEEGSEAITGMLAHPEWYVVRNMADLVGELEMEDAVPALGKVVSHQDDRVRRAVGVALARIGTAATVPHLRQVLKDTDPTVRIDVFRQVSGKGLGALAMPLVTAIESDENPEVRAEYLRALGRIGTTGSIEALKKAAEEKPGLLKRKATTDNLAAVEGLALAKSASSVAALEELKRDAPKDVRDAAKKALRGTLK